MASLAVYDLRMGRPLIDLTGLVFGELTVTKRYASDRHGNATWLCRCSCGNEKIVRGIDLRRSNTMSCGCRGGGGKLIDLIGQTFGEWLVIKRADNADKKTVRWICRCSCGTERAVIGYSLSSGGSTNCGCVARKRLDLTDQTFGHWRVLSRCETNLDQWRCRCTCGNERILRGATLRYGSSKSCGCSRYTRINPNPRVIDLTGHIYGELTVIERRGSLGPPGRQNAAWLCRCSCGTEKVVRAIYLRQGKVKTCGHWRGNGYLTPTGYRIVYMSDHPNATKKGTVLEHIVVMSEILGRSLLPGENVHHRNGVKDDNRPENLELWVTSQPSGQRPEDLVAWAYEIIKRYAGLTIAAEVQDAGETCLIG